MAGRFRLAWPLLAASLFVTVQAASAVERRPPNVVVLLADDSGWGDYRFTGNTNLKTPHIDSLARDGAVLDRFFVCSVCAPTRAEFLTGRYHPRGGVRGVSTGQERLNLNERTIADAFRAAGYATGAFGKWHNGSQWPYHPLARGFQEYYGFTSGHWGEYFDPPLEHNGQLVRGRGYIADDLTDHALEFLDRHRSRPFFCYLAFNTPHSPWAVPQRDWERFRDAPIGLRGSDSGKENLDETRCALAMVENLDANIGRVLKRLDELRVADETIVVYFSDNGPNTARWNGGMKGRKGTTDEGGVRSVCCIRWPGGGIRPGTVVSQIAGAIDLLPTLASLAGVPRVGDFPLDGRDLKPLLVGQGGPTWPERLLFSNQNGNVSVRSQRYRLDNAGALFDMLADPGQKRDIAAEQPEEARRLADAVATWRRDIFGGNAAAGTATFSDRLKGKARSAGLIPDDRPFPVGYVEFPWTPLPARDGTPHGGVRRSAPAPNCSYFVNWTSRDDSITWNIEVRTAGTYEVTLHYTCPEADAGSTIALEFQGQHLTGKVQPGWDPPLYTNQDTLPRPFAESRMKEFRPLRLGTIELPTGRGPLKLSAVEIPGKSVMDLRLLSLTLLPERR